MASDAGSGSGPMDGDTSPVPEGERARWAREVLVGLSTLGSNEREALMLTYFDGMRFDAVARRLDLPPQRVHALVANALIRLATFLETPRVLLDQRASRRPKSAAARPPESPHP